MCSSDLEGVLIKNAEALERMETVDTLVVDKTGTLTEGKPKVVSIVTADGFDETEMLRLAASVERAEEAISSSFSNTDDDTADDLNIPGLPAPGRLAFYRRSQTHH